MSVENQSFRSHGKLLITGEYFVLDGALSLAFPTKLGQSLTIESGTKDVLIWESFDDKNERWFDLKLDSDINILATSDKQIAKTLIRILKAAFEDKIPFGCIVKTHLDFDRSWGLGTSSTLINNIAQWANIDSYLLLEKAFGGSAYDIACADAEGPILFQRNPNPIVKRIAFNPPFQSHIYFVYLNKKQNSKESIKRYHSMAIEDKKGVIQSISEMTEMLSSTYNIEAFMAQMSKHEDTISRAIDLPKVKDLYFNDFDGAIKSLGGWGGDFVMAVSKKKRSFVRSYFINKGYPIVLGFDELIHHP